MTLVRKASAIAMLVGCVTSCTPARVPGPPETFGVRLVGASEAALRGDVRGDRNVFVGRIGGDYGIEISNRSSSTVGVSIIIDGLSATSGNATTSCVGLGSYDVKAKSRNVLRSFPLSDNRAATFRFAPAPHSLAAITPRAVRERIGTIEVCFFSLKPWEGPIPRGHETFAGTADASTTPVVAEVQTMEIRPAPDRTPPTQNDVLLARVVIAYEDEDGRALGTAPPPPNFRQPPGEEPRRPRPEHDVDPVKPVPPPLRDKKNPRTPKSPRLPPDKDKG